MSESKEYVKERITPILQPLITEIILAKPRYIVKLKYKLTINSLILLLAGYKIRGKDLNTIFLERKQGKYCPITQINQ